MIDSSNGEFRTPVGAKDVSSQRTLLLLLTVTTEADKGQSRNNFKSEKNISNRNVFGKSLSKKLSNLKHYAKSE